MQATRADVLGVRVDLCGDLGDAADALGGELDTDAFGGEQCGLLSRQRGIGFGEDAHEVLDQQGIEFDADREAALQLRDEV